MRCAYQYKYCVVKRDENLVELCTRKNLNLLEVKILNDIKNYKESMLGRKIKIPSQDFCCKSGFFYRIKKYETIIQICKKNKISIQVFMDANPYFNIKKCLAGQIVIIPYH